ncbi:MAG: 50S ribosomal protein L22, partial [Planctomycetia bacterium]
MSYFAIHKNARIAPTKVRKIADLIRKRPVDEALERLQFLPNRGARYLEKVLKSAIANAEDLGEREMERLVVVDARIDEGPRLKRIQPHARGMAFMI